MTNTIVTIDGPAGSGKTTVSSLLAKKLKFIHLNSGILYRSLAKAAYDHNISYDDENALLELARGAKFDFRLDSSDFHTTVEVKFSGLPDYSIDTGDIYDKVSSDGASKVGTIRSLREILTDIQRSVSENKSLVLEGRDAGTVVFPDATYKFYLDASFEERAKRRVLQRFSIKEDQAEFHDLVEEISAEMQLRDERDSRREESPLSIPHGARVINTDGLEISEVVNLLYEIVNKKES